VLVGTALIYALLTFQANVEATQLNMIQRTVHLRAGELMAVIVNFIVIFCLFILYL
jgi:hypothetical protein